MLMLVHAHSLLSVVRLTVGANIMFPCEVRSSRTSPEVEAKFVRS